MPQESNFNNKILQGDSLTVLKTLPSESVDCIITSPPYWALRDYKTEGIIWDAEDCEHEHDFQIVETKRPNVSGGSNPKLLSRKGKENFQEYVDYHDRKTISNICQKCNAWKGQLGQEPTIDLYINHLIQIFDQCKRVLKKTGTCWVVLGDTYSNNSSFREGRGRAGFNKESTRILKHAAKGQINEKSLCLIPERFALKMIENKWILRSKIIWFKPNCMPSSAKDRFTVDYENVYFFTKSQKYYFKTQYEPSLNPDDDIRRINAQRQQLYDVKYTNERGYDRKIEKEWIPNGKGRIKRCVWKINTKPFPGSHFAVMPEQLVKQCLNAGCPVGGVTLDPFMGSGTVGLVALKNAINFVGIELNPEYITMAEKRLGPYLKQEKLTQFNR